MPRRYPANWQSEIVPAILARAHFCCEGSFAHPACRAAQHLPRPLSDPGWSPHEPVVHLTVVALDGVPMHTDPANLKALCPRCRTSTEAQRRAEMRRGRQPRARQLCLF
jgi:hypothetical protein